MRAQLAALVGVEAAFEEGAEDRGVDAGPVEMRRAFQVVDVLIGQRQRIVAVEQAAVEPFDAVEADLAAAAHGGEEGRGILGEQAVVAARAAVDHGREIVAGQQLHIFGEHAEDQAVDEMRDGLRIVAALAQAVGDGDEARGGLFGQGSPGLVGFQAFGVGEGVRGGCRA